MYIIALYDAGELTVNFSRGGKATKALDVYVPYTNAGVQGLDKFYRELLKNPKKFLVKGAAAITIPTIAQEVINRAVDPEGYDKLSNRVKDAYFVIAVGDGKFIKVPKSRELGVIMSSLFQRVYRQAIGQEGSFKGLANTMMTSFAPANPLESNLLSPIMNLRANKDFADRPIVPMGMELEGRPAYLQFDEKTSELAIAMGEKFNLSPKEIDYIIRSYTGVIGQMGLPAMTKADSPMDVLKSQFTADVAYSNKASTDFYENLKDLKAKKAEIKLAPEKGVPKSMAEYSKSYDSISSSIAKINRKARAETDKAKLRKMRLEVEDYMTRANKYLEEKSLGKLKALQARLKAKTKNLK